MFGFFQNPSREKFAQIVLAHIREKTGQSEHQFNADDFSLRRGSQRIFLNNLYADYCQKKGKDRKLVLDHIATFARQDTHAEHASLDEVGPNLVAVVRERLLVSLADVNWGIERDPGQKILPPVFEPISRWFLRTVVIDAPSSMAYVNEEQMRRWNLTTDEIHALALANLQGATVPKFVDKGGYHAGQWGDAYDASRILVPGVFDDLPITGEPVVVLPNRDTLLVADSNNPTAIMAMLAKAEEMVKELARPQNIAPLVLRGGVIHDYEVSAGSPAFSAVARARALAWLSAYVEQKAVLEKVYERSGKDIYVGEHTLTSSESAGVTRYLSYCVWSRGVPTLVPMADDVVFYDPDAPDEKKARARVPWSTVREVLDDLMLDTKMFPPRFYVSQFPSPEQFARMTANP